MHRLTQNVVKESLGENRRSWAERVVTGLTAFNDHADSDTTAVSSRHVDILFSLNRHFKNYDTIVFELSLRLKTS